MSLCTSKERALAIRFLSIDAVQKANSGHPGMPMGMADIAEVLWHDFLRVNPENPQWSNRDRFVLSNGHGSMLLYALLHLTGFDLSIEDLKQFRQLHSKTPGHPEQGETPGVETTTGPLGQGLGNAIGMAIAEKHLAAQYNRPGFNLVDHYTYCFVGDGCLMEGISHEVSSLAGTLGLGKLIVFYDDNGISIDGEVSGWFSDNTPARFEAYHWHVIPAVDGHDRDAIHQAIIAAQNETERPTLICCQTTIGWGSPNKAGRAETHGAALGIDEIEAVRTHLDWAHIPFSVPQDIYTSWDKRKSGAEAELAWTTLFKNYQEKHPALATEFLRVMDQALPPNWQQISQELIAGADAKQESVATRKASKSSLSQLAQLLPELMGGSADLAESNGVDWQGRTVFSKEDPAGCFIHFGVREFGMSAILNGMALHRGILPFGATFLTFSDYARNAIRLAALMKQRVVFVYTHDSIGLGEDGPTHQPIEHLPSLRIMPHLSVWRPCDGVETMVSWLEAVKRAGPTSLIFTRQKVPHQMRNREQLNQIQYGGYVLLDVNTPDVILIATGSEVELAMQAAKQLQQEQIRVRVVSMPSTDTFLQQSESYRHSVLPPHLTKRVAIEAAASAFWHQFVGPEGAIIGIDTYGASAKDKDVFEAFGFTVEHVVRTTKAVLYSPQSVDSGKNFKSASI
ncbi:MAG: transketolase [Gammaproteobacteria bacterium]|nr:transketolase [Gammaproteobacteria bacterium]